MRIPRPFFALAAVVVVVALSGCGSLLGSDTEIKPVQSTYSLRTVDGRSPSAVVAGGMLRAVRHSELKFDADGTYVWRSTVEEKAGEATSTRFEVVEGRYSVNNRSVVLTSTTAPGQIEFQRKGEVLRYVDSEGTVFEFAPAARLDG